MSNSTYHHGDLANALVAAALALVERGGAQAVSLRDLAGSLGVSRAAPYRHFADRDALLAAVAARGFEDLNKGYEAALASPGDGRERLRQASVFYFDFAARRPGLFRLMFESDLLKRTPPAAVLIPPADRAYRLLWQAVGEAYPAAESAWIKAKTLTMWSTMYGFLALDRAGRFKSFMVEPLTRQDLVEAVLDAAT
ncbi:MAG: TetR/AcrR family transcriptional regulator [Caulobacterales bacterium]